MGRPKKLSLNELAHSLEVRFWAKVDKSGGCWLWTGSVDGHGYGQLATVDGPKRASRISWEMHHGSIPRGIHVCHRCDTPPCVRPDHLFLGSARDNSIDMSSKGRSWFQKNPDKCRGLAHHRGKLSDEDVARLRARLARGERQIDLATEFGVSKSLVSLISRGLRRAG